MNTYEFSYESFVDILKNISQTSQEKYSKLDMGSSSPVGIYFLYL